MKEKLRLLLWKGYRLRRYKWKSTLAVVIIPLLITYLFVYLGEKMLQGSRTLKPAQYYHQLDKTILMSDLEFKTLMYAPQNNFTDKFMLGLQQSLAKKPDLLPFPNEEQVVLNLSQISKYRHDKAVIFYDLPLTGEPDKLNYSIRDVNAWNTHNLFEDPGQIGPSHNDPYFHHKFITLQLLVNEQFVRLKSNNNQPKIKTYFQGMPYPEYYSEEDAIKTQMRGSVLLITALIFMIMMLILAIPIVGEIIEEKEGGLKELMKLAGVDEWMIWLTWFLNVFIISMVTVTVALILLSFPIGTSSAMIQHLPFAVLWIILAIYCVTNVFYCFLFAAIFHKGSIATTVCVITLILGSVASVALESVVSGFLANVKYFLPILPFMQAFTCLSVYEIQASEFEWKTFLQPIKDVKGGGEGVSILLLVFYLIIDAVLYAFLTYYITCVNPGPFGVPESPLFIFKGFNIRRMRKFNDFKRLFSQKKADRPQPLRNLNDREDTDFIEKPPATLEATLHIRDLYKFFGSNAAVNGVNLDAFKGEILALLGHNGAGKTTTLSVLTGLTAPSNGSIVFRGMDVFQNMTKFRSHLGMCLQENRLFSYLTVKDHLKFFGMLKGATEEDTKTEAREYLHMMDLELKKNSVADELSGGMKRKLCLAVALMGKAEILILDEPTSGMDVQTRRNIWDLLSDLRGSRTIILTTHHMEEADALGDRIAIMQAGHIVCYGTPIFLKKAYGTGYKLTIVKSSSDISRLTNTVTSIVPDSTLDNETQTEVVYNLPLTETDKFPSLFKTLESNKSNFGIENMGVSCTTMEHVFLKAGGVSIYDFKRSTTVTDAGHGDYLKKTVGLSLYIQQMFTLFSKKALAMMRNSMFVAFKFAVPTLFLLVILWMFKAGNKTTDGPLALDLNSYPNSKIVYRANGSEAIAKSFQDEVVSHGSEFIRLNETDIILESLLNVGRSNLYDYNTQYVIGAEFNATEHNILYNLKALHSFPAAVTTYYNAFLKSIGHDNDSIHTINYPVDRNSAKEEVCKIPDGLTNSLIAWFLTLGFYTYDALSQLIEFRNKERTSGFKHMLMMSHVSSFVYWFSALIFDFLLFAIVLLIRMLLFRIFDQYGFLSIGTNLGVSILVFVIAGTSTLIYLYALSSILNSEGGMSTITNIIFVVVTFLFFIAQLLISELSFGWWAILFYGVKYVILLTPPMNFFLCFLKILQIWRNNLQCTFCAPELRSVCMKTIPTYSYLVFPTDKDPAGINWELCFLIFDMFLYSFVLGFLEGGFVGYWFNELKKKLFGIHKTILDEGDDDVKREFDRVQDIKSDLSKLALWTERQSKMQKDKLSDGELGESIPLRGITSKKSKHTSLLVDGLRKNYLSWFRPFTAVADVNFAVDHGECFGLLGVNGAGKTTTFKMLTAEIWPTLGDAAIDGIKLSANKPQYLSMAGYCAQTNCFVEELTGREMLSMIAKLRGVGGRDLVETVNRWITTVGLEEFQNRPCGKYSGGNKRKTCTAMALIGDPRVVFLDEPTSGVDPVSRRKLYDVMEQSRALGQSVILTSHSMEECETLCDRITIMSRGVMKCLGTVQRLKKRYAQGFSLMIKLDDDVVNETNLVDLKKDMNNIFNVNDIVLKDEHKGMLYYQLKDTSLLWSVLFEKMELLKHQHEGIIEDYVLTDTTLEEVFISFAQPENEK